jgi:hypothetical protein
MAGTSSAKTRFALLPGHDGVGDIVAMARAPVIAFAQESEATKQIFTIGPASLASLKHVCN